MILQPSSSSRAAESLESSGGAPQGFIGFGAVGGGVAGNPGYVPVQGISDEVDLSVDADLRMILRKLSKKDAVTKQKVRINCQLLLLLLQLFNINISLYIVIWEPPFLYNYNTINVCLLSK